MRFHLNSTHFRVFLLVAVGFATGGSVVTVYLRSVHAKQVDELSAEAERLQAQIQAHKRAISNLWDIGVPQGHGSEFQPTGIVRPYVVPVLIGLEFHVLEHKSGREGSASFSARSPPSLWAFSFRLTNRGDAPASQVELKRVGVEFPRDLGGPHWAYFRDVGGLLDLDLESEVTKTAQFNITVDLPGDLLSAEQPETTEDTQPQLQARLRFVWTYQGRDEAAGFKTVLVYSVVGRKWVLVETTVK